MAGHSKWANIKHRKAAQDAKRGKAFTKLIRELVVSARTGGGQPADNPRLRAAVDKALAANMTRDTINRAIARGLGGEEGTAMEEITYEGYGPGGVAILVECLSDNRNRTASEVRHAFSKHGGNLGTGGSVAYLFQRRGQILFTADVNEERLMEAALEAGADDIVSQEDGSTEILTDWTRLTEVKDVLEEAGFTAAEAEVTMLATTEADLDAAGAEKLLKLVEFLEDLDDVQNVYSNAAIAPDVLQQLS
ncbi:MAG: YebC/PmpR family DNA-binding transcriptional regulator [Kistimonas sp.]|nr:YebC/PmpR family DNA-binding transcriptional regulator [Kistimonas sp.]